MKERVVSLGIFVFALVYLAGSISLKVGTPARPGAGLFPTAIAAVLLVVAAFNVWRIFRSAAAEDTGHRWAQLAPAGIAGALIVYPFLLHTLSFLLSTFVVLFTLFRLLRYKTVLISLLIALITTVVSFLVFSGLLGVVLPTGVMEKTLLTITGFE